ncbi:MAG: TRAP transporter substrate-binding protein DctP, partial [Alphaproteobacteria bacterium]|nr:TRAP transporter substrate-binding protein DctP [Alphaproteobacteria bacterium]
MISALKGILGSALIAASAVAVTTTASAQEFKLRWGHYLPNSPFVQAEKDFAAKIEERTGGRVKIDITFAGGLGKGNELLPLAGRGAVDMAAVVPGYYADRLLFWKAYQIPFIFNSPKQAMEISAASYKKLPVFKEELDKMGVMFLFHQPLGEYYLTGKSPDCDTVAGLKGKKIRSFGADIPKLHQAVGATPVSVGVGAVYEALQRGSLDYSFLNRGNILSNRLYEPGKYNCGPIMSITGHLIVISKRAWAKLPDDIKTIMVEEGEKSGKAYIKSIDA